MVKKGAIDDVKIGYIIVYFDGERYIIHRVIEEVSENVYSPQGDNKLSNPIPDKVVVMVDNYYGKYVKTTNYLNLQSIIKNRNYLFPLCILIFLLILISEAISISKTITKERKRRLQKELDLSLKAELKQEILAELKGQDGKK